MANWQTKLVAPAALLALAVSGTAHAESIPDNAFERTTVAPGGQTRLAMILAQQGDSTQSARALRFRWKPSQTMATAPSPPVTGSAAAPTGKPDVFGTIALKVRRSPLDDKWRRVLQARLNGRPAVFARALRVSNEWHRMEAINRYVNSRVGFVDDSRQYRRTDVWTTANETLRRGQGDCEDYAIAKLQILRAAGFSDRNLYLVILKDLVRRSDHAVVIVRSGGRMFVLDNGTDRVLESDAMTDYRPILTLAASGVWTHGYKVIPASMEIAAGPRDPAPALTRATM